MIVSSPKLTFGFLSLRGLITVSVPSLNFKDLTLPVILVDGTIAGRRFASTDASDKGNRAAPPVLVFVFF